MSNPLTRLARLFVNRERKIVVEIDEEFAAEHPRIRRWIADVANAGTLLKPTETVDKKKGWRFGQKWIKEKQNQKSQIQHIQARARQRKSLEERPLVDNVAGMHMGNGYLLTEFGAISRVRNIYA